MIIIGYQGIGKSTLARKDVKFIDLESGNFWHNGERPTDWFIYYCQIAENLSKQGYFVFVSSHKEVREQLAECGEKVVVCVPDVSLKEQWINKLQTRYENTHEEKDYKALMNAKERYEDNIKEIMASGFTKIVLNSINYDLRTEILKMYDRYIVNKQCGEFDDLLRIDLPNEIEVNDNADNTETCT